MTKRNVDFYAVFAAVCTAVFSLSLFPILKNQLNNTLSLPIGFMGVFFSYLILGGLFSFALSMIALLCGRWFTKWMIVAALSIAAIAWIKGSFMQWDYGPMDGTPIDWSRHSLAGTLDIVLIVAVIAIAFWQRRAVARHAMAACAFLCLAQILFFIWISPAFTKASFADLFAKETILTHPKNAEIVSTSDNLILIVLDTFPSDVFGEIVQKQQNFKTEFSGFTFFSDAISAYPFTWLSIPSVLTGQFYFNQMPYPQYLYEAYRNPLSILSKLKQAGYFVELDKWGSATPIPHLIDLSSNSERLYIPQLETLGTLQLLALYSAAPQFIKRLWYDHTFETFMDLAGLRDNNLDFIREGMTLPVRKTEQPVAKFIHLKGPHVPLYRYAGHGFDYFAAAQDPKAVAEQATGSRENFSSVAQQSIKAVSAYLEKLKQAGVYDRSTVVIFGDHGAGLQGQDFVPPAASLVSDADKVTLPVQMAAFPLLLVKPANANGPLQSSLKAVSLSDLNCSIQELLEKKVVDGCRSLFKPAEITERESRLYYSVSSKVDADWFYPVMRQFKIGSPGWSSDSWRDTGEVFLRERAMKVPPYDFGSAIKFGRDGNSQTYEAFGWDSPGEGFTWTIGPRSTLTIPLRDVPAGAIVLEATFTPFVYAGKLNAQRVQVYANGERIAEWTASESGPYRAVIPQRLASERSINIRFRLPDAISPLALGINDDASTLGVQMQTVMLRELAATKDTLIFGREGNSGLHQIGGWGDPSEGFTWTIGKQSSLALQIAPPSGPLMLKALLNPLIVPGKLDHQTVYVYANDEKIGEWIATQAREYRAVIPQRLAKDGLVVIRFDLPDASSPAQLGTGVGREEFGLQMRSLTLRQADYRVGDLIKFGRDGNAAPFQIEGWNDPSEGFTWTLGTTSRIALPVNAPPRKDLHLEAMIVPFIVPDKLSRQRVEVSVNGKRLAEWSVAESGLFTASIPSEILTDGIADIRFDLPDATSQAALGLNDDASVFALQVISLALREVP